MYYVVCFRKFRQWNFGDILRYDVTIYTIDDDSVRRYAMLDFNSNIVGYLTSGQIIHNFISLKEWNSELKNLDDLFNFYMDHHNVKIFEIFKK